jgi:hypothetical protein
MADDSLNLNLFDLATVTKSIDSVEGAMNGALGRVQNKLLAIGSAVAGAFALRKIIAEAVGAENALNDFNAALRATGQNVGTASAGFQKFAEGLQEITTASDDAIIQNAALLVSVGKLRGEGLERATKAALDLSAGLNKDLGASFELVAKAASGNTAALARYGLHVDQNIPKSLQFAEAIKAIEGAFGGMAENKVNTFSGATAQLENRFNDLLETLGKMIIQSPVVIALVKALGEVFLGFTKTLDGIRSSGDVVGELIKTSLEFGQTLITWVVAPLELLYNFGKVAFHGLRVLIQSLIVVTLDLGAALTEFVMRPLIATMALLAKAADLIGGEMSRKLNGAVASMEKIPDTMTTVAKGADEVLVGMNSDFAKAADGLFDFSVSDKASRVVTKIQEVAANAKPAAVDAGNQIGNSVAEGFGQALTVGGAFDMMLQGFDAKIKEFAKNGASNFRELGASMLQTLGGAAGQAFAAFGKAIAKGENAIGAFLNSLLASLGQAAVQMGTQFMLQGAAYMWAGMSNGPPLIAAGAALATFGGILAGLGGGKDSGGGGGSASGGGVGAAPGMATSLPAEEEKKAQTSVIVNVQGNILDRKEAGLELIEIMNEHFSANDGRLVRAV